MDTSKQKKIDSLFNTLKKKYGEETIRVIRDSDESNNFNKIERWPVDSLFIADILGGGVPKGRLMEIYGKEGSGKSTLATYFCAEVQKKGGTVAYIDAEHAFDPSYAMELGFKMEEALFSQPGSGEEALDIVEDIAESGEIDLIVIDSVAALTPKAELEGQMGDQQMGLQARLMGKACRKITAILGKTKTSVIFINQVREKIGGFSPYSPAITTPGGRALPFYSSIRLETQRIENIMDKNDVIGMLMRIKTIKNKTAMPFKKREVRLIFGKGFESDNEYVEIAIEKGLVQQSGAWFTVEGVDGKLQGKHAVAEYYNDNEEAFNTLKDQVHQILFVGTKKVEPEIQVRPSKKAEEPVQEPVEEPKKDISQEDFDSKFSSVKEETEEKPKKKPGRPRKNPVEDEPLELTPDAVKYEPV